MKVIGIDLAGTENRPTGFCIMNNKMNVKTKILYKDREIIKNILEEKPKIIAIDAPLSLPKGRKSLEQKSNIHLRECDRELLRNKIKFFPITLGPMRELTKRGIRLKKILNKKGFEVIEVYPGGAQDLLKIPRKSKSIEGLRKGLEMLGIKGLSENMTDHELDAVTSAFVAKLYLEKKYIAYGNNDEGVIIMPKL
jgi:predicted nuclease with RNAse H fold